MDELKIGSKFTRMIVSKALKLIIKQKTGYDMDIQLNDLNVAIDVNGQAHAHVDIDAEMSRSDILHILKNVGLN